jgi:predicted pyridoxine 5'-phosphate oxidase superfamily flavin-nucleotide-binding protein
MSSKALLAVALAAPLLSGCALIAQGTSQDVTFTSDPPGALFTVAGRTEVTPATIALAKDAYEIVFMKEGYEDLPLSLGTRTSSYFYWSLVSITGAIVDLAAGAWQEFETTEVHAVLKPMFEKAEMVAVQVTSEPPGAEVIIGEAIHGRTPLELKLGWMRADPEKSLTLQAAGFVPKTVALRRDATTLHVPLEPRPFIVLTTFTSEPEGAQVWLEGTLIGKAPLSHALEWLPDGAARKVEMKLEGYEDELLEVGPKTTALGGKMREAVETTSVRIVDAPPGASITVDGVAVAMAPAEIQLRWSKTVTEHVVAVSQPGYKPRTVTLRRADVRETLEMRLEPALGK